MRICELQQRLSGGLQKFTLTVAEVKQRIGEPIGLRIAERFFHDTGRDLVMMTYQCEDGAIEVMGPVGFLEGEQAIIDGWCSSRTNRTAPVVQPLDGPPSTRTLDHLRTVFEGHDPQEQRNASDGGAWKPGQQLTFGDEV